MLTLRLQRAGKRNRPEFRIVLAEKTAATSKKFLEILGNYNPRTKEFGIKDENRLKYWVVEQHVQISPTLNNLLVSKKLIDAPKQKAFLVPTKAKAKKAEAEAKAQAETEAAKATEAAASAVPEKAEETPPEPAAVAESAADVVAEIKAETTPEPEKAVAQTPTEPEPPSETA